MSPDVENKLFCFVFINYRHCIFRLWEEKKYNLLHHRTTNSSLGAVGSVLFVDSNCVFPFYRAQTVGEEDLRFNLRTRWKSQHRCQEWKIVSIDKWKKFVSVGLWWFWQMGFCPCHCDTTDMQGPCWWNPASRYCLLSCFLFFFWCMKIIQQQQVGGTRGIIDV